MYFLKKIIENISKNRILFVFLVIMFLLLTPISNIYSQTSSSISVTMSPSIPKAYENVVVEITSSVFDLNRSTISWLINNDLRLKGTGETIAQFTTKAIGDETRLKIIIVTPQNKTLTKNLTIRPTNVDILWEAISYTPPFYRGKALGSSGGLIKLTAQPEFIDQSGKKLNPKELVYTWKEKGFVLGKASGFGKQSIILENGSVSFDPLNVSVEVSSLNKIIVAQNSIKIPSYSPGIIFYEKHPLEGVIYNRSLGTRFTLLKDEITLRAEPYFFSLDDVFNGLLKYDWKINNKNISIDTQKQTNEITFGRENASGVVKISLDIENENIPFRVFQEASILINIELE